MMVEQQYIELFSQTEAMICKHSAEVLNAPRASAFADFERLGFPTRKMEKYKYTDVSNTLKSAARKCYTDRIFAIDFIRIHFKHLC